MSATLIYLVAHIDWELHEILSAWTTREAAEQEATRLKDADVYHHNYEVEEITLDVPWSDA